MEIPVVLNIDTEEKQNFITNIGSDNLGEVINSLLDKLCSGYMLLTYDQVNSMLQAMIEEHEYKTLESVDSKVESLLRMISSGKIEVATPEVVKESNKEKVAKVDNAFKVDKSDFKVKEEKETAQSGDSPLGGLNLNDIIKIQKRMTTGVSDDDEEEKDKDNASGLDELSINDNDFDEF